MNVIVLKFGGSSLTTEGYQKILSQIKILREKYKVVVVLSAVQDTTNNLISFLDHDLDRVYALTQKHLAIMEQLGLDETEVNDILTTLKRVDTYTIDLKGIIQVIGTGERLSTIILNKYLEKERIKNELVNSKDFIYSSSRFEEVDRQSLSVKGSFFCNGDFLMDKLKKHDVVVMQGFIASTSDGELCLLSRGGSDTTASLVAEALNAKRLEIWTDVNGIYSGDPNTVRGTRLVNRIGYDLCQELAAMGAKVLHPYSIKPCQKKKIPIVIKNTYGVNKEGKNTVISSRCEVENDEIVAITNQKNVTVYDIKSLDMWNNYGFLHDIFGTFSSYKIDINIIITSQFSVRVTTDDCNLSKLYNVARELERKYMVKLNRNCNIVSIVGYNISTNAKISKAQEIVKKMGEDDVHIIHYSSNNLTLSYVVNSEIAGELTQMLHDCLVTREIQADRFEERWWAEKSEEIVTKFNESGEDSLYLYNLNEVNKKCRVMKENLTNISHIFYAMKANNNLDVLKTIIDNGFGVECVSIKEIEYIRQHFGNEVKISFTPNYCMKEEYRRAYELGALVIVDNIEILLDGAEIFKGREIGVRVDCDIGDGHHEKVITEGEKVKFGLPINELHILLNIARRFNIHVTGLHSHKGSGILDNYSWKKTAVRLAKVVNLFPDLEWINLGGGFGIKTNGIELNFEKINRSLSNIFSDDIQLFIEPGRYLVAEAGVLVSRVTQVRHKNNKTYVGLSTGMNSLLRPSLYNAYHPIYNLSRINDEPKVIYDIVGPICETGDVLGEKRLLPTTLSGDICIIDNSGAYGKVMSSEYNMRKSAKEEIL